MNPQHGEIEYKLRVPRNLAKNYYVMKLNSPRPVHLNEVSNAFLKRQASLQGDENLTAGPDSGAGSEYGKEKKEETKKKRRGYIPKEIKKEDMLYSLRIGGKKEKRFLGRKEGSILENSAYYILTQCPDGVFEAMPIQAWYNFTPTIDYHVLSSDDVEKEFSRRDKTINYHNMMLQKRLQAMEEKDESQIVGEKVKKTYRDSLVIHDDEEDDEDDRSDEESDNEAKEKISKHKKKDTYSGKKKQKEKNEKVDDEIDTDEEEEFDNVESKEFDYMSESSSNDEEEALQDEPEPEMKTKVKAKDDLNAGTLSESENEEDEEDLTSAGKELKEILKREAGEDESSEDEDEDIDESEKYSKSALFMPGNDGKKKKTGKSGSISGSNSSSRSNTPTSQPELSKPGTPQSAKKPDQSGSRKRPNSRQSEEGSPPNKKGKLQKIQEEKSSQKLKSKGIHSQTGEKQKQKDSNLLQDASSSKEPLAITEATIRRYLSHKPMTTTDLVKKLKKKKTGLTKDQTISTIAAIIQKIGPERQIIDGKLYLSIKPAKK